MSGSASHDSCYDLALISLFVSFLHVIPLLPLSSLLFCALLSAVSSEVLGVDDAGAEILARLQAHGGGEPAATGPGARGLVAERGAVGAAGVLGVDDGRALEAQGPVARLQVDLGLVTAPGAVG